MNRAKAASLVALTFVSLQGCSLIIDTNPDGVIRDAERGGSGGKTTVTSTNAGMGQNGGTAPGGTGNTTTVNGGSAGTATAVGGTAGAVTTPFGGAPSGGVNGTAGTGNIGTSIGGVGGVASSGGTAGVPAGAGGTTTLGGTANLGGATSAGGTATGGATATGTGGVVGTAGGTTSTGGVATGGSATGGNQGTGGIVCSSGTACGSSCVNLQTDASNCGACGHSCRYAASSCIAGKCQPVVLATNQEIYGARMTQDADYVYWLVGTLASSEVRRAAKNGSTNPASAQSVGAAGDNVTAIAIAGNTLQWNNSYNSATNFGGFGYVTLDPLSSPTTINATIGESIDTLTASSTRIYVVINSGLGTFIKWAEPRSPILTTICGGTAACSMTETLALTVDATHVYWLDWAGEVWKVPLSGGSAMRLATLTWSASGAITILGDHVYCNSANNFLIKVATSGLELPAQIAPTLAGGGQSIAADTSGVYWAGGSEQSVWWLPTGTITPLPIAGSLVKPNSIVVDATTIYWTDIGAKTVMAVAK